MRELAKVCVGLLEAGEPGARARDGQSAKGGQKEASTSTEGTHRLLTGGEDADDMIVQLLLLLGVESEQRKDERERVPRRLVPGEEEDERVAEDLAVRQALGWAAAIRLASAVAGNPSSFGLFAVDALVAILVLAS